MRFPGAAALVPIAIALALTASFAEPGEDVLEIRADPFTVRAPSSFTATAERVAAIAPGLAERVTSELALPPIPSGIIVLLGREDASGSLSGIARAMPGWAAGQAFPGSGTVLIRVDRIGSWGQREIGSVLAHELGHLAVSGSLPRGGAELPRWVREGIASAVAREREWWDRWVVWTSRLSSAPRPFNALEAAFGGTGDDRSMAYAGSLAAINFLKAEHGRDFPARLLQAVRAGADFPTAFRSATGRSLAAAGRAWKRELGKPRRLILWIGSTLTLWAVATLLILFAWAVKRRRSLRTLERWRDEEEPRIRTVEPDDEDETIH